MLQELLRDVRPDDRVRLTISSTRLHHDIWLPFMQPAQLTVDRVMIEADRVLQSNKQWLLEDDMFITFIHAPLPVGGGFVKKVLNLDKTLKIKRCIVNIPKSKDNLCCARAIITAKARVDGNTRLYETLRKGSITGAQYNQAAALHLAANVPIGTMCGKNEWDKFQAALGNDYELIVVSREFFNSVVYKGDTGAEKKIILYHADDHFSVITSMTAFLERSYYCFHCHVGYTKKGTHKCLTACHYCKAEKPCAVESHRSCFQCCRVFVSEACMQNHIRNDTCRYVKSCKECGKTYHTYTKHRCGHIQCRNCGQVVPYDHKCYVQPLGRDKKAKNQVYIFYDFECMLDKDNNHVPNLAVANKVCQKCMEIPMNEPDDVCECAREQKIFKGASTLNDFCDWLFNTNNKAICLAHNAQAYDLHLIMQYIHERGVRPEMIRNGQKILCLEAGGLKFIDSLNFFPMALAKLPKAFDLTELSKGFFPHLFSTAENQDYVGPMPGLEYYDPDGMKSESREAFLEWYKKQTHFDFQKELVKYCVSDVDILQRSCGKFRSLFLKYTDGIEPFLRCITIASACNLAFRTMFLQKEQVAIIPACGYHGGCQSAIALCWMDWLSEQNNIRIKHAKNGGEEKVEGIMVDGVDENGTLYMFQGCFWHGCDKCYSKSSTLHPVKQIPMKDLRQHTRHQIHTLRSKGYTVVEKWECAFREDIAHNHDLETFYNSYKVHESLKPRDAFFGGRTNGTKLFYQSSETEKIRYVDFTSLYPWVCKYAEFPVGHPDLYFGLDIPDKVFGLLKCKVLPPQDLYHPVLPYRSRNKLLFPLCRTCADENYQGPCPHDDPDDRALTGTWVSVEIDKAIDLGYTVLEKYEAWHFPNTTKYNPVSHVGGIWSRCINLWLKQKQQADDWPSWCVTSEDRDKYIRDYRDREGIDLDPSQIVRNEGLRSLAKLMLNSLWGKMGQNPNKSKTAYIGDCATYIDMMTSDNLVVSDLMYVNEEFIALTYNHKDEFVETLPNTNVVLAAFTTAHARLKLYTLLESLQDRVLYFDTDSVVYVHVEGLWNPPLGDYLGELKDETKGVPITTFVTGGAKNYAYELGDGSSVCKIRGFTLNHRNSLLLNYQVLEDLITTGEETGPLIQNPHKICRQNGRLFSRSESKQYKIVYDKRVLCDNFDTRPFGFA